MFTKHLFEEFSILSFSADTRFFFFGLCIFVFVCCLNLRDFFDFLNKSNSLERLFSEPMKRKIEP